MTEQEWVEELTAKLDPCGCNENGATVKPYHGDFYVSCWNCTNPSVYSVHAYQAVNEWNEARRGEK